MRSRVRSEKARNSRSTGTRGVWSIPATSVLGVGTPHNRESDQAFADLMRVLDAALCVVAFVGFAKPLSNNLRGMVNGCGFAAIDFEEPEQALRTLQRTLRVDAVVVHARLLPTQADSPLSQLLAFAEAAPWDGVPLPVVVLGEAGDRLSARHVHVLDGPGSTYARLGRLVSELCHVPGACCAAESLADATPTRRMNVAASAGNPH
jgi:hypothetical protein